MRHLKTTAILAASIMTALAAFGIAPVAATAAPAWDLEVVSADRVIPGKTFNYWVTPKNVGDEATTGVSELDVTLPPGVTGVSVEPSSLAQIPFLFSLIWTCDDSVGASTVHCERSNEPFPGFPVPVGSEQVEQTSPLLIKVAVDVDASGLRTADFQFSGGGASDPVEVSRSVNASSTRDFGLTKWSSHIATGEAGKLQAGGHPASVVADLDFETAEHEASGFLLPDSAVRNIKVDAPAGFVGSPASVPTCDLRDLIPPGANHPRCPIDSIIGTVDVRSAGLESPGGGAVEAGQIQTWTAPIFNMKPPKGEPARFGFTVLTVPVQLTAKARTEGDLGVQIISPATNQGLSVTGATTTFWGIPGDSSHDKYRCQYYNGADGCQGSPGDPVAGPNLYSGGTLKPFLTNPTSCNEEGLRFDIFVDGWPLPRQSDSASFTTTDEEGNGPTGCDRVPFQPEIQVQPTTDEAETPTGLEVVLNVPTDGINNPTGISQSHLKDAVVTLPEGMTANPSQADGLAVCTPSQIGLTSGDSRPIRFNKATPSCPEASQIAEVKLETPLLLEPLSGAAYLAQQVDSSTPGSENPFNSDLALYVAIDGQGVLVKLAGEVAPDPHTGRLVTKFLNNPQQPFSRFSFKFKGGPRAPLSMPPTCGTYAIQADLTPWARPNDPIMVKDTFQITKGPNGGPCPSGGVPPFKPGFTAGSINNNAASYSPFVMRLTRNDGEQSMTKFSSVLPPGVVGKLAGVSKCSDAALAAAPQRTGRQEIAAPSCPASSQIGRIEAGAGVGSLQVYVPGKIYLAGPYKGAPLSVAVITPAVAGPFDVGNVLVREALDLNPKTAEVQVDGNASDPIPHILKGIPLRIRDLRVFVDRDNFIINPTSCDPSATKATLFGSFLDVLSPADDVPVALEDRFQAANCANLGFKPRLDVKLRGGTKRGGHPALTATYTPRPGDANVSGLVLRLPRSAFLDQAHIRTICTRVQFAADNCPPAAQYGYIKAFTPLLDEPLQGPVWLRSSNNKLPDLVFDLKGIVDVEVSTRIDSVRGGIRASVESAPDAPLSKVVVTMQGGKKGLIVNSTNLCRGTNRGETTFTAHNGKAFEAKPVVKPTGCKGNGRKGKRKGGR